MTEMWSGGERPQANILGAREGRFALVGWSKAKGERGMCVCVRERERWMYGNRKKGKEGKGLGRKEADERNVHK